MTYVVTDRCIKCKYTDYVEVCPIDAIKEESFNLIEWIEINKNLSKESPNITKQKDPLINADKYKDEEGKYEKYISKVR